ncbi:hypothetical protein [Sphingomonas sp.]|uniref:hypothetical protein n=1 Tax=Sphingomonas sp. TaxID=28214 RepID=UPI00307ECF56
MAPPTAAADLVEGIVVYDKGCGSRFIVETNRGFALVESYGITTPDAGGKVVGNIDSYGFTTIYVVAQDRLLKVYVDDYMLTKDRVIQKLREKCG